LELKLGHPHYVNAVAKLGVVEAFRSSGEVELNPGSHTLTCGAKNNFLIWQRLNAVAIIFLHLFLVYRIDMIHLNWFCLFQQMQ
jgi:hypothetical protein